MKQWSLVTSKLARVSRLCGSKKEAGRYYQLVVPQPANDDDGRGGNRKAPRRFFGEGATFHAEGKFLADTSSIVLEFGAPAMPVADGILPSTLKACS